MARTKTFRDFAKAHDQDPDELSQQVIDTCKKMSATMDSKSRRKFAMVMQSALSSFLDDNGNEFEGTGSGDPDDDDEPSVAPLPGEGAIDRKRRYAADEPEPTPGTNRPGGYPAMDSRSAGTRSFESRFPEVRGIVQAGSDDTNGMRRKRADGTRVPAIAMDERSQRSFAERFPNAAKVKVG